MSVRKLGSHILLVCALLCLALPRSALLALGCESKFQDKLNMKNYLFQSLEVLIKYRYIYTERCVIYHIKYIEYIFNL